MSSKSYLAVCMNPTLQKVLCFSAVIPNFVNRTADYRLDAAGKGINVCRVLQELGKNVAHLTQLGGMFRPLFLELCRRDGLSVEWVESGGAIRFCYTLIDREEGSVTELVEESEPVLSETGDRILEAYRTLLPSRDTVIISGTKAAGFSDALIPTMVRQAKDAGKEVILDLRGPDLRESLPFKPDVIKPNLLEFAATFAPELLVRGNLIDHRQRIYERIREICGELCARSPLRIVLTRGAEAVWFAEAGVFDEYPVEPTAVENPIGSGDAFTAGLAAALGEGAGLRDAVAQAVRCGSLNAGFLKVGTIRG